jgi:hypothetical protein
MAPALEVADKAASVSRFVFSYATSSAARRWFSIRASVMSKTEDAPVCARCHVGMELVLSVPAADHEQGLRAYICPRCDKGMVVDIEPAPSLKRG